jgi:hypothetical protein
MSLVSRSSRVMFAVILVSVGSLVVASCSSDDDEAPAPAASTGGGGSGSQGTGNCATVAGESECGVCTKQQCCTQVEACAANANCKACVLGDASCNFDEIQTNAAFAAINSCQGGPCAGSCQPQRLCGDIPCSEGCPTRCSPNSCGANPAGVCVP